MKDNIIVSENELNYIETLYLSCNLQDFVKQINFTDYDINIDMPAQRAYDLVLEYLVVIPSEHYQLTFISEAKGRLWYQGQNYRLGIMPYDRAKKANQYNCVIQYEHHHLYEQDKMLTSLSLPFGGSPSDYKIKRIDITKIAKQSKDYLTNYDFISPFRRKDYVNGTVYLGNRSNGCVFRMYNKTKELEDTKNYKKTELFSKYFVDVENLYTYELELQRSYLKENLGIDTLDDLNKVYDAYYNIVGQIRFFENNDKNKLLLSQGNRSRIDTMILTDFREYERVEKKRYSRSFNYLVNNTVRDMKKYLADIPEHDPKLFLMEFASAIFSSFENDGQDMIFSFEESDNSVDFRHMMKKFEVIRENQTDDLEKEAIRAFLKPTKNQYVQ